MMNRRLQVAVPVGVLLMLLHVLSAVAATYDEGWTCRRPITVEWNADRPVGDELAVAEFLTAGKALPDGSDIRITTEQGRDLPQRVLRVGPGDRARVLFALSRAGRRYFVYFGHPKPPPSRAPEMPPVRNGLLLEMKRVAGFPTAQSVEQIQRLFEQSRDFVGGTMIDRLYLGLNPLGDPQSAVVKISGAIFAPIDGTYTFAVSAQQRGGLMVAGKSVCFAPGPVHDTRFRGTIDLKRGKHDIAFYQLTGGTDGRVTVVWQRPDTQKFDLIPAESFGTLPKVSVGPLEQKGKSLTADIVVAYKGEAFFANRYTHRYVLSSALPKSQPAKIEWELGDGQVAAGPSVEHVYLADGIYPVKVTAKLGATSDTQTFRVAVSRDYPNLDRPATDQPTVHSAIVAQYSLPAVPPQQLPWVVLLHGRARRPDAMLAAARQVVSTMRGLDANQALSALREAADDLLQRGQIDAVVQMWAACPADSPLQPRAAREHGQVLLWNAADFAAAATMLERFVKRFGGDNDLKRLYGQALVLSQKAAEGRKVLESLPAEGNPQRRVALSGAMARTVEYYIKDRDWEAGNRQWDRWQTQFPGDFLEGYSVLLWTQLMEIQGLAAAAAKVAEAFALAVPQSSYAPQLLDRASRLLEKTDPARSQSLRQILKQKYPEDPLAQEPAR